MTVLQGHTNTLTSELRTYSDFSLIGAQNLEHIHTSVLLELRT